MKDSDSMQVMADWFMPVVDDMKVVHIISIRHIVRVYQSGRAWLVSFTNGNFIKLAEPEAKKLFARLPSVIPGKHIP